MESYRISIIERFPLVSVIMPYYSFKHEMFLLLSILSKKTRKNLAKNYEGFRRIMHKYSKEIIVKDSSEWKIKFPYDLFKLKFNFDAFCSGVKVLITFIDTIF